MSVRLLVTGFPSFHIHNYNPSQIILPHLARELQKDSVQLETLLLPVDYKKCFDELQMKLTENPPNYLVMLGLAASRHHITLEECAVNLISSDRPDNEGRHIQGEKILREGKSHLFTTLPLQEISHHLKSKFIDHSHSKDAGTYVCNLVFYKALNTIEFHNLPTKAGFIHLPPTQELDPKFPFNINELSYQVTEILKCLK